MQFQDDLAAGTVLVRPALQSPNYVPGTSGWAVFADGTAEFNGATIRTTLQSSNYVPGVSGWHLDNTGAAEFSQITLHGAGIIKTGMIDNGAVTTPTLGAGAVTATALGTGAVTAPALGSGAVTAPALGSGAVTAPALGTGAVGYQALAVGTGNLVPDPSFEGAYAQTLVGATWTIDPTGNNSAHSLRTTTTVAGGTKNKVLATIPVIPGERYYLACDYQVSADWTGTAVKVYLNFLDGSGASVGVQAAQDTAPVLGGPWKRMSMLTTAVPANAVTAQIRVEHFGTSPSVFGSTFFDNAEVRTALVAGAVAAGLITTGMLAAGSVTADRLDANAINGKTITGATIISGLGLYYGGTPAAGNLVASIAPAAGTDSFGNSYPAGFSITGSLGSVQLDANDGVMRSIGSGGTTVLLEDGSIGWLWAGQYSSASIDVDTAAGGDILMSSGAGVIADRSAQVGAITSSGTPTAGNADTYPRVTTTNTNGSVPAYHYVSGAIVKSNLTGTTAEVWQTPSFGTGWASGPNSGTVQPLRYRKDAQDNLVIVGACHSTSTTPAAAVFTLPAAYRPVISQRGPLVSNAGGTATERFYEVNSSGAVSVNANLTTSGTDVYWQVCVPLGNIA